MGLLRMLLAISVLTAHIKGRSILGWRLIYGNFALECFFMISGFYMALVLNEKYNRKGDYFPFLWQRVLRLFPAYLAVLALTMFLQGLMSWAHGQPQGAWNTWTQYSGLLAPLGWVSLICSNLFLLGQQIGLYQAIDPATGHFYFISRYGEGPIPAKEFIFVPQSWTLSIEIIFYILAPWLVRRSVWLQLLIVAGSVAARVGTSWMLNPTEHPWHHNRFFPYELAFFMAGSLAYQIYRHQKTLLQNLGGFYRWFRWVFLILVLYYSRLPGTSYLRESIFVPLLFCMIPLLFYHTKNNKRDRLIGEMSYPFYLGHLVIFNLMYPWLPNYVPRSFEGAIYCGFALILAYLIYRGVDEKVDRFRHRLFERERGRSTPAPPTDPGGVAAPKPQAAF